MGAQAVALAKAVGYDSAGTVEFVAGQDKDFYFLEMNTRLQVEHPVTELITGIDLVEQMIRVAAGETLRSARGREAHGWAVESRVYAEDPDRGFLPSIGRLVRYRPPAEGERDGARCATTRASYEGGEISMYYDPMIAKLVTHAPTRRRRSKRRRARWTISRSRASATTSRSSSALMAASALAPGRLSTGFIAEEFPDGFEPAEPDGRGGARARGRGRLHRRQG